MFFSPIRTLARSVIRSGPVETAESAATANNAIVTFRGETTTLVRGLLVVLIEIGIGLVLLAVTLIPVGLLRLALASLGELPEPILFALRATEWGLAAASLLLFATHLIHIALKAARDL